MSNHATVSFSATLERFGEQGEKTGWTYVIVPETAALKMHSSDRKGFRVKGWLDDFPINQVALMPMGDGNYILPVNAAMRKQLKQPLGARIIVRLSKDASKLSIAPELLACLDDAPEAKAFFDTLAPSHQKYFSKWIDEAKTTATRIKRLTIAIEGLSRKMDYGTMIRWGREQQNF